MISRGVLRGVSLGIFALASLTACSSSEASNHHKEQVVCAPTAPTECPEPAPHFPDVAPIFERRCASCHNGTKGAPWPLDTYGHVADWATVIRDELMQCLMPPEDSGVEMTAEERQAILVWVRCGSLE
jgi:uncharacterized membrane protein